jgi:hypothetical protein
MKYSVGWFIDFVNRPSILDIYEKNTIKEPPIPCIRKINVSTTLM